MKRTDCRLGAEKRWPCCCFFSLLDLEVTTGRGELAECSKLTCFAKRMLDMVPGDSVEIGDRCRQLSGIVGVLVRSKASWGREK